MSPHISLTTLLPIPKSFIARPSKENKPHTWDSCLSVKTHLSSIFLCFLPSVTFIPPWSILVSRAGAVACANPAE